MKRLSMWNVYKKGNLFRLGYETRGGMTWYMLSEEEPRLFWDTDSKIHAFTKAHELNNPVPVEMWTLVVE